MPTMRRIAAGDYETTDGAFRIHQQVNVTPPAWDVVELPFSSEEATVFAGVASYADAKAFLDEHIAGLDDADRRYLTERAAA